jgi:flagellar hook-length control protein FliK
VAAQVAPVVINIAQRPAGTHQLTMTVNPDSLGPVTVRAHIAQNGDIQVQLSGATDAGRDALRTIVAELRRDLAAVSPHATLTIGSGAGAEAGTPDRGAQPGGGGAPGGRPSPGGESAEQQGRHGAPADGPSRDIPRIVPTTTRTGAGAGLDIFA